MRFFLLLTLFCSFPFANLASAQIPLPAAPATGSALPKPTYVAPPLEKPLVLNRCRIELINDVEVSTEDSGVITKMYVTEGSIVKRGGDIAMLDPELAHIRKVAAEKKFEVAKFEAENDIPKKYAEASRDVAQKEYEAHVDMNKKAGKFITSAIMLEKFRLQVVEAGFSIQNAVMKQQQGALQMQVAAAESKAAEISWKKRRIKAHIGGMVVKRFREVGEWAKPGEPIVQIHQLDKLRVKGFVTEEYSPNDVLGRPATVKVQLGKVNREGKGERELSVEGKIVFAKPEFGLNDRFEVWAEIENVPLTDANGTPTGYFKITPGRYAVMEIR